MNRQELNSHISECETYEPEFCNAIKCSEIEKLLNNDSFSDFRVVTTSIQEEGEEVIYEDDIYDNLPKCGRKCLAFPFISDFQNHCKYNFEISLIERNKKIEKG